MMEVLKPFYLMFLTNNIFILFKCFKSPVLRCLYHLTCLDKQHSLCTTAPTLNILWFPLPSKMMKLRVCCDVALFILEYQYQSFREASCTSISRVEETLPSWSWKQHAHLKQWYQITRLQCPIPEDSNLQLSPSEHQISI